MNNSGHLMWILMGATVGFASSCILEDFLTLPVDVYYLIYLGVITVFFATYVKKTKLNLKGWFSRRLLWGILLGSIFSIVMIQNVLSRPKNNRPLYEARLKTTSKGVVVYRDRAYEGGKYSCTLTPRTDGEEELYAGTYLHIWQRQADDTWKLIKQSWTAPAIGKPEGA